MDDRLKTALETASRNVVFLKQKMRITTQLKNDLIVPYRGNQYVITLGMIAYLDFVIRDEEQQCYIETMDGLASLIEDPADFLGVVRFQYEAAMSQAYDEIERLKKNRTIDGMTRV